jgi:hypothetical protein
MERQNIEPLPASVPDVRLYFPDAKGWTPHILTSADKVYCFAKNPGEDYYHLILSGELYLQRGDEVFCLLCALRHGVVTQDRLFWQRGHRSDYS